ncbi:MAG TPA: hypothetical protein VMI55_00785 [Thermoplasmata archaeon]|nr:hypothetical protein [Thermoplasmata archaeon]
MPAFARPGGADATVAVTLVQVPLAKTHVSDSTVLRTRVPFEVA